MKKLLPFLLMLLTIGPAVADSSSTCGDTPLYLGKHAFPKVLLIVDLSGSMAYGFRPDWTGYSPQEEYEGYYSDKRRNVFRRIYYGDHFVVVDCADSVDALLDGFKNPLCTQKVSLWSPQIQRLTDFDSTCVDDALETYGIADWTFHNECCTSDCADEGVPYAETDLSRSCEYESFRSRWNDFVYPFYPSLYEDDTFVVGNFLNTTRVEIVAETIKTLARETAVSLGLGFFKTSFGQQNDYTRIEVGVLDRDVESVQLIERAIDEIAHSPVSGCEGCVRIDVGGATPFAPSIDAARKYFLGQKPARIGGRYQNTACSKKFAIFLTDGIGNVMSSDSIVEAKTRQLVESGVTVIAVGFNLADGEDSQLRRMAFAANDSADGVNTFALHRDTDGDGLPDPFIARSPKELLSVLKTILYEIEKTAFISGAASARKTELGSTVVWTSFDAKDWTGEIRTGHFRYNCANCHSADEVRYLARWKFFIDLDGDGRLDIANEDLDGDGRLDTKFEDRNKNGELDEGEDLDGDGHLDVPEDLDGDGHLDSPEPINFEALEEFLRDSDEVRKAMGSDALKGYDPQKIDEIISILRERDESRWWKTESGWSTNQTLLCRSDRNIKYGTEMRDFEGPVGSLSAEQVAFIRGEVGCSDESSEFRSRSRPLGDIIFSQPRVHKGLLWIGANDGMLHAFDVNDGREVFAYIPESMLNRYAEVGYWNKEYCHAFLFDATPTVRTVGSSDWLIVGLGRGSNEYIALDITDAPDSVSFKWSFSDPDLAAATNEAKIVRCSQEEWGVLLSTGRPSSKTAHVFSLSLDGGLIAKASLEGNSASAVAAVDSDGDRRLDYVYVGDDGGNLFRFSGCSLSSKTKLLSLGVPITASPVVTTSDGKAWVFFGTGKYDDVSDIEDLSQQWLVGFFDDPSRNGQISLIEIETEQIGSVLVPQGECTPNRGWKIRLRPGERVITPPTIHGGSVFFLTFVPDGDECSGGGSTWLYVVDYNKGCNSRAKIDVNDDGRIDKSDLVDSRAPMAVYVGRGSPVAPPVFVSGHLVKVVTTEETKDILYRAEGVWIKPGSWTDVDVRIISQGGQQ